MSTDPYGYRRQSEDPNTLNIGHNDNDNNNNTNRDGSYGDTGLVGGNTTHRDGMDTTHRDGGNTTHTDGGDTTHRDGGNTTHSDGGNTTHRYGGNTTHRDGGNATNRDGVDTTHRDMDRNQGKYSNIGYGKNRTKPESVRKRFYDNSDMNDVIQDKISTQLRENGIAETKVLTLSAKISQAVRDDVIDSQHGAQPQVTKNLCRAINAHIDPVLHNKEGHTNLSNMQRPKDATHLSNMVLLRLAQIQEEVVMCKSSVDESDKSSRRNKGQTPRDRDDERSQLLSIKDSIEKQKTEKEILEDRLRQAQRDSENVDGDRNRKHRELQDLENENDQLRRDLQESEQDKQSLISKVIELQKDHEELDRANTQARSENNKLRKQLENSENNNRHISSELAKLQSERARLLVLVDQKDKEIVHLNDPDRNMVYQVRILKDEVTMLRTQTRRLNEEKGHLKSRNQKMENSLDDVQKQRNKLLVEREGVFKENQELKQRNRKMALSNPRNPRNLPDIMSGRNGPGSRVQSRNTNTARMSDPDDRDHYK